MKKIIIIGAGGHAKEIVWLIEEINKEYKQWDILGFIDNNESAKGKIINGYKILGDDNFLNTISEEIYLICAIGESKKRYSIINKINKINKLKNLKFATLIHPKVIMSDKISIDEGTVIGAGCILTTNIKIGKHVIINPGSIIAHDSILEDYSTILNSVNISGNVHVKMGAYLGVGTKIIDKITIGEWSIIGAGAVVISDIPAYSTSVGVPAKPIKFNGNL